MVFVDNPVGTGFSYAEDEDKVARGIEAISADLLAFMQTFLQENVQFKVRKAHTYEGIEHTGIEHIFQSNKLRLTRWARAQEMCHCKVHRCREPGGEQEPRLG